MAEMKPDGGIRYLKPEGWDQTSWAKHLEQLAARVTRELPEGSDGIVDALLRDARHYREAGALGRRGNR